MYTNFSILNSLGIPNIPAAGKTNGFPYFAIDGYSGFGDADELSADPAGSSLAVQRAT